MKYFFPAAQPLLSVLQISNNWKISPEYAQEVWKAGAGSHGPISLQMAIYAQKVPFTWNVNRMEGSSFIAGAGALGLALA